MCPLEGSWFRSLTLTGISPSTDYTKPSSSRFITGREPLSTLLTLTPSSTRHFPRGSIRTPPLCCQLQARLPRVRVGCRQPRVAICHHRPQLLCSPIHRRPPGWVRNRTPQRALTRRPAPYTRPSHSA